MENGFIHTCKKSKVNQMYFSVRRYQYFDCLQRWSVLWFPRGQNIGSDLPTDPTSTGVSHRASAEASLEAGSTVLGGLLQVAEARRQVGYVDLNNGIKPPKQHKEEAEANFRDNCPFYMWQSITDCDDAMPHQPLPHLSWINLTPLSSAFKEGSRHAAKVIFIWWIWLYDTLLVADRAVSTGIHRFRNHFVSPDRGKVTGHLLPRLHLSECPLSDIFFQSLGPSSHAATAPPDTQTKQEKKPTLSCPNLKVPPASWSSSVRLSIEPHQHRLPAHYHRKSWQLFGSNVGWTSG